MTFPLSAPKSPCLVSFVLQEKWPFGLYSRFIIPGTQSNGRQHMHRLFMSLLRKGYLYYSFEHSTHKLKYIQYCSLPWSQDCLPTRVHTQSVSAGGSPIANVHMVDVCLLGVAHSIRCSNIVVYQHTGQTSYLYNGMGMGYGMAGVWQYIYICISGFL